MGGGVARRALSLWAHRAGLALPLEAVFQQCRATHAAPLPHATSPIALLAPPSTIPSKLSSPQAHRRVVHAILRATGAVPRACVPEWDVGRG